MNKALGEYVVQCWDLDDNRFDEADYYTDDRQDALETAACMMQYTHFKRGR